jgi:hypothetical protein
MQALAAEFSGYAGKIPLLFGEKCLKQFVLIYFHLSTFAFFSVAGQTSRRPSRRTQFAVCG